MNTLNKISLSIFNKWEKIWLITSILAIVCITLGLIFSNTTLFDLGDDISWFYDECLCD